MYFKFISENEVLNLNPVRVGDRIISNPTYEMLQDFGLEPKEKIILEQPQYNPDTQYLKPIFINGDKITQDWRIENV